VRKLEIQRSFDDIVGFSGMAESLDGLEKRCCSVPILGTVYPRLEWKTEKTS
jgi:hypothetical protein